GGIVIDHVGTRLEVQRGENGAGNATRRPVINHCRWPIRRHIFSAVAAEQDLRGRTDGQSLRSGAASARDRESCYDLQGGWVDHGHAAGCRIVSWTADFRDGDVE